MLHHPLNDRDRWPRLTAIQIDGHSKPLMIADFQMTVCCPVKKFEQNVETHLHNTIIELKDYLHAVGYMPSSMLISLCELEDAKIPALAHLRAREYIEDIDDDLLTYYVVEVSDEEHQAAVRTVRAKSSLPQFSDILVILANPVEFT